MAPKTGYGTSLHKTCNIVSVIEKLTPSGLASSSFILMRFKKNGGNVGPEGIHPSGLLYAM